MSVQNLKFIHLGSAAAAKDQSFDAGSIIFEPASGRIVVQGTTPGKEGLEYYGGGRIADATFDTVGKVLTLSFNDGSDPITLDFSDTASAVGVNKILGGLRTDVNTLKTTVGDAGSGLVKAVADNATNIKANSDAIGKINDASTGILADAKKYTDDEIVELRGGADGYKGTLKGLDDEIKSNDTDITALQGLHKDGTDGKMTVKEEIDAKVDITEGTTVKKYVDDAVSNINLTTTRLDGRVEALETTVNGDGSDGSGLVNKVAANTDKLTTLIGSDESKSVRTIANEELAAQLIPAGAKESLDTLQEIAAWIQSHPGDAATMNVKIAALETTVNGAADGDGSDGLVKKVADNATNIKKNSDAIGTNVTNIKANADAIGALEALHVPGKSVATEVSEGITGIAEHSETNDDKEAKTADVVVTVTTKSGSVSAVGVDASVLRKAVTAETTRAKEVEDGLRTDLGETGAAAGTDSAFARIKALEEAQSSGSLMWSVWD